MPASFGIVIHGGAGVIVKAMMTAELVADHRRKLEKSLQAGYALLENGGASLDAVQAAVVVMEDSPLFNAGVGAVFTHDGVNEQDACIMDGKTVNCGALATVRHVKNPILLARAVMDRSEHVLLSGEGAEAFARLHGIELVDEEYFYTERRWRQLQQAMKKESQTRSEQTSLDHSGDGNHGTVGAVALDRNGDLAAATSSGGMTNKKYGRIGDSSIIGAGNYASNNTCAVSTTGHGEYFMRYVTAFDVSALMEYKGLSLEEAADAAIHGKLTGSGGTGGLIAIDKSGNIAMPFNTPGMYRGCMLPGEEPYIGIFESG